MAPTRASKMKQACAASPGKFAAALLDILDGTVSSPTPVKNTPSIMSELMAKTPPAVVKALPTPAKKSSEVRKSSETRKRPAAAVLPVIEEVPAKKTKVLTDEEAVLDDSKIAASRSKELKSLKITKLKELAIRRHVDVGSKEKMIKGIIAAEAKSRENVRKHRTAARDMVLKKRKEFDGKTNRELKELLQAYALTTGGSKPERVERLLKTWQEQGEIEKVLAGMAYQARKAELSAMDKVALFELCRKKGVDGLSKDVLVDRLLLHESVEIWQEVVEADRLMGKRNA